MRRTTSTRPIAPLRPETVRQRHETELPDSETFARRSATHWNRISPRSRGPSANPLPTIARRRLGIAEAPDATVGRRHATANNAATNAATATTDRASRPQADGGSGPTGPLLPLQPDP